MNEWIYIFYNSKNNKFYYFSNRKVIINSSLDVVNIVNCYGFGHSTRITNNKIFNSLIKRKIILLKGSFDYYGIDEDMRSNNEFEDRFELTAYDTEILRLHESNFRYAYSSEFILTLNALPEAREWYRKFNIIETQVLYTVSKGSQKAKELIITNY